MIAANSASSSSYEVRIRPWMDGSTARTSRQTSMPLPSGRRASRMATSGRSAGIRRVASCAEPDSPTTSMSPSALQQVAQAAPDHLVVVEQEHSDHALFLLGRRSRCHRDQGPFPRRTASLGSFPQCPGESGHPALKPPRHCRTVASAQTRRELQTRSERRPGGDSRPGGRSDHHEHPEPGLDHGGRPGRGPRPRPGCNTQPWRFRLGDGAVDVRTDPHRAASGDRPGRLGRTGSPAARPSSTCGWRSRCTAPRPQVTLRPDPADPHLLARLARRGRRALPPRSSASSTPPIATRRQQPLAVLARSGAGRRAGRGWSTPPAARAPGWTW